LAALCCAAWNDNDRRAQRTRTVRQARQGIRAILQSVEDALIDAGYDDFVVACQHGTFRWQTVEHGRMRRRSPSRSNTSRQDR
jgi:hypothetical protein